MFFFKYVSGVSPDGLDKQSVIVHELGHAIGIVHCHELDANGVDSGDCLSWTCPSNVMSPTLDVNTTKRNLTDYDIASKQLIYW